MYKPRPIIALTCLLDLLFVLIFASLLMVEPTYTEAKITVDTNHEKLIKSLENEKYNVSKLTKKLEQATLINEMKLEEINRLRIELDQEKVDKSELQKLKATFSELKNNHESVSGVKKYSLIGHWDGKGCQGNHNCWTISIDIPDFKENISGAKISYPSLKCSGNLEFVRWDEETAIFRERLLVKTSCIDNGWLYLTPISDDKASFVGAYENGKKDAWAEVYKSK